MRSTTIKNTSISLTVQSIKVDSTAQTINHEQVVLTILVPVLFSMPYIYTFDLRQPASLASFSEQNHFSPLDGLICVTE